MTVVDLGCGVGNDTLLNILAEQSQREQDQQLLPAKRPLLNVHFVDASAEAIERLRGDARYQRATCAATSRVCNLASPGRESIAHLDRTADAALMLFALSAVGPYRRGDRRASQGVINAVKHAVDALRPGLR